jgi:hypothetical protein
MRFELQVMQVCIFHRKNYNSIVQGLVVVADSLQYFFLFYFVIFYFFIFFIF